MEIFYGVVEDRKDPLLMGRLRVRVLGIHSESKIDLPISSLPWAMPMTPITSASNSGIGETPLGAVEGSWVIVIFSDTAFQYPVVLGTLPGFNVLNNTREQWEGNIAQIAKGIGTDTTGGLFAKVPVVIESDSVPTGQSGFKDPNGKYPTINNEPDLNRLARKQKINETIVRKKLDSVVTGLSVANGGPTWSQSPTGYNPTYPFNHVTQTESGHIIELDDSEGAERINIHHKAGTFIEIDNNGSQVNRIVGNNYTIVDNDGYIYIKGSCVVNIDGDAAVNVKGSSHLECAGSVNIKAKKDISFSSDGDINIDAKKNINIKAGTGLLVKSKAVSLIATAINSKFKILLADGKILLNSGLSLPIEPVIMLESFKGKLKSFFVPSLKETALMELEDLSNDQLVARGVITQAEANEIKNNPPQEITKENMLEKSKASTVPVSCEGMAENPTPNTQLSPNYKLKDFLKPSSGGSVVAQHNLTAAQIACNLKWVAVNIAEPIKAKYPSMVITSGFRLGTGTSQHERGQAMDFQFGDIKTRAEYYNRCIELIKLLPAIDQIIFEVKGSTIWVHISSKSTGNRGKITSYNGVAYSAGLTQYT